MAFSQREIIEYLQHEVEEIARACLGRVQNRKRLDQEDDDFASLNDLLERWGDRKVPQPRKEPH